MIPGGWNNVTLDKELLGHADIKMTMRYAHLSQTHLKEAVAVLNNLGIGSGKQIENFSEDEVKGRK
jgi:hypothetical protein